MRAFRAASPLVVGLGGAGGASPLLTDLVAYWKLDEASGSGNRADSTGRGNTLVTSTGGSVSARAGKIGNGYEGLGFGDYLTCASNSDLVLGDIDWTIAVWIYLDYVGARTCLAKETSAAGPSDYILYVSAGAETAFFFNYAGGSFLTASLSGVALSTWYFTVVVHDSVNNLVKLSRNGSTFTTVATTDAPITTAGNFKIGAQSQAAGDWGGVVDEVGIWKRAVSQTEVTTLYNSGAGLTYPF